MLPHAPLARSTVITAADRCMRLCKAVSSGATHRETSSGVRGDETSHLDRGTMILSGLRHPMFRGESEGAMKKPQIFGLTDLLQNPAQCLRSERPMPIMMRSSVAQPWPRDMSQIGGYRPVELIPVPGTDPCPGPIRARPGQGGRERPRLWCPHTRATSDAGDWGPKDSKPQSATVAQARPGWLSF